MSQQSQQPQQSEQPPPKRPEVKFGPYLGGISIAVWLNTVQTPEGRRTIRSVTISPRRYRDSQTGEWKDSGSFRPSDLPALNFGIQQALEYIYTTPLPDSPDEAPSDEVPF